MNDQRRTVERSKNVQGTPRAATPIFFSPRSLRFRGESVFLIPRTLALVLGVGLLVTGCVAPSSGPYAPQAEAARDPLKAQDLTLKAAEILDRGRDADNLARAESLLRDALAADLYHGPAHNDLGVVYLVQHKLYEAAGEFEWARKLMPGHPDPRMNLALTLERAGRTDEALDTYRTALEVYPGHTPTMQALARLQLRTNKPDDHTPDLLRDIALRGETQEWKDWARRMLVFQKHTTP